MHHALCHRQGSHGGWNINLWRLGDLKVQWPVVDAEGRFRCFFTVHLGQAGLSTTEPLFRILVPWGSQTAPCLLFFRCFPKDLITRPSWERCGAPHFMTCPGSHQCAKYLESEKNRGGHACLVILPDISKRVLKIPGLGLIHCAESIRSYFRLKHGNNPSRPMEIGNCVQSHSKRHIKSYKHCKYGTKFLMSIATLAGSRVGFSEVKWHFAGGPCRKHQALMEIVQF